MLSPTQPSITPSYVPTTPFAQMTEQRRSLLDSIADYAQKAADVATIIKAPAGTKVESFGAAPTTRTPFPAFNFPNLIRNPVVVAGAAIALVLFLKK